MLQQNYNMLQHTATGDATVLHESLKALQHTATHCNTLQHTATILQHTATGDGTVLHESLKACSDWQFVQEQPVTTFTVTGELQLQCVAVFWMCFQFVAVLCIQTGSSCRHSPSLHSL